MQGLHCLLKLLVKRMDFLLEVRLQIVDLIQVSLFFGVVIPKASLEGVLIFESVNRLL